MARRYSLEPFLAVTGWTMVRVTQTCPCNGPEYRRRRDEGVTELIADRLAHAAGRHPYEIWPAMCDDVLDALERQEGDAIERRRASWRKANAKKREQHPERERARKAQWAAESRRAITIYKREWNRANRERVNAAAKRYRERKKSGLSSGTAQGLDVEVAS